MKLFQPKRVFFEEDALDYPLGKKIIDYFANRDADIKMIGSHNRVTGIPGDTPQQSYREAKQTLVVGVKRDLRLDTCKPSADFEFSLGTSCPGGCQYCYLQTHLGKKPYIRVYVNIEEILDKILEITQKNQPNTTSFEAASTSDPLAVEHITGSLAKTIEFFGRNQPFAKLRVVTKFANVDTLLGLNHNHSTKFRFSLNSADIIRMYEHNTASMEERIRAANKIAQSGYSLGFIIAPLFIYDRYHEGYTELFRKLADTLKPVPKDLTFELITHRFTKNAKKVIHERFPNTKLDLNEISRRKKFGRYGLVKYIYNEPDYQELKNIMMGLVKRFFPQSKIEYFT